MSEHTTMDADTSFVPRLDARQRAMLAEMGVKVWAPKPLGATVVTVEATETGAPAAAPRQTAQVPAPDRQPLAAKPVPMPEREALPRPAAAPATAKSTVDATLGERPPGIEHMEWPALRAAVAGCSACGLCRSRHNTVFGTGDTQADWMVVGDAPDETEDLQGEPFAGAAGQLLDNMLRAIGRSRGGSGAQATHITNALKCRPPPHRNPLPEELAQCEPYLARQVALVRPKVILAMGRMAVQALLKTSAPMGQLRGQVHRYQGVPVIVTYHPNSLLRTPADKAKAWADLCLAMDILQVPMP